MADRDGKGKFAKGNQLGKKNARSELQELKSNTKAEIIRCAHSLTLPFSSLKSGLDSPNPSRLEYLTSKAIEKDNIKWIQWLIEMAIGRPKETFDVNDGQEVDNRLDAVSTQDLTTFIKKVAANAGK